MLKISFSNTLISRDLPFKPFELKIAPLKFNKNSAAGPVNIDIHLAFKSIIANKEFFLNLIFLINVFTWIASN